MIDSEWQKLNPIDLFEQWFKQAQSCKELREPNAMAIATYSKKQGLSNRIVLLKQFSKDGFYFYTNYDSPKGLTLAEHDEIAALFYWDPLGRQVRITGHVVKASRIESETYWNSRSRESQLSQYISKQSEVVESRGELERLVKAADKKFKDQSIPCPPHWGGYIIKPERFEFWETRPGRLHERVLFKMEQSDWTSLRLYP